MPCMVGIGEAIFLENVTHAEVCGLPSCCLPYWIPATAVQP